MKLSTKFMALLMALLMLVSASALTSCNNDSGANDDTTPAVSDTTTPEVDVDTTTDAVVEQPAQDLVIVADGKTGARVIRNEDLTVDDMQVTYASQLCEAVKAVTGASPKIGTDWVKPGTEHDHDTVEVLVGYTEYSESLSVLADVSYGEYVIKVVGNKLVVAAYSQAAMDEACRCVKNLFSTQGKDGELIIPADTYITGVADDMLDALPVYEGDTFKYVYSCGGDGELVIVNDTTVEQYNSYLTALDSDGWTQYTTNTVSGNYFATYNNDKYTVNLGFYDYEDAVRIIIEPLANPVGLESDNVYEKVTTSQITTLGLEYTNSAGEVCANGQSMLIRLDDGRFIVVDGGFDDNSGSKAGDLLVAALKEQSKDYLKAGEKITIAAWIITHTHSDHSGMIIDQYSKFMGMNIEKFIVNFISETEINRAANSSSTNETLTTGSGGGWRKMANVAKSLGSHLQFVHVGQVFYIANVKMDILYTLESYAPKVCNAFNTTSMTIKFTFDSGDTFLLTGDTTGNGMQIAVKTFGEYIQSDILQVSHHGATTWGNDSGTISAYRTAAPETLLWPVGTSKYEANTEKSYNKVLFAVEEGGKNANFKESLYAGLEGEQVILPIPYSVGNAIEIRK
ncbi:MAG: hypothetical protein IJY27_05955 [Clostridia bacterium]|nr:hypothetical protein [Clostridia bacterium]